MSFCSAIKKYLCDPDYRFCINADYGLHKSCPDREYLERLFRVKQGMELNLSDPQSFNEKLQWLKLYNRDPRYTALVDKYRVRDVVREKIGGEYLIPLLGVWDRPEEIDFESLPQQFVLKCNHNSGLGMYICRDKAKLNRKKVIAGLSKGLKQDYYLVGREWPYKDVQRKIICEQYMVDESGYELKDYKVYCINGRAEFMMIVSDRFQAGPVKAGYLDRNGKRLPFSWGFAEAESLPDVSGFFDRMLELAEILAAGIPQVRIDFYYIKGRIYFGEMTFFDGSGFDRIQPREWDYRLGSMLKLPEKD